MAENRFDEAATTWDDNPRRMALTKAIAQAISEDIPLTDDMTMLEFGCGTAALSVLLADRVGQIRAVDTSVGMIDEVQRKLADLPELTSIITPSVITAPVEDSLHGMWDLICSAMVMHHIEDAMGTLRHLVGCLRPGGYLALADLYPEDGSFHGQGEVSHHGFDPQTLTGVLEEAGLVQTQVKNVLTFPKPGDDGKTREYSVFLLTARRNPPV